jgi:hypothetical protein
MNFMDSRGKKTLPRSGWRDTNFPSVKFWQHQDVDLSVHDLFENPELWRAARSCSSC